VWLIECWILIVVAIVESGDFLWGRREPRWGMGSVGQAQACYLRVIDISKDDAFLAIVADTKLVFDAGFAGH
jgi:hypothetical protein